MATSVQILSAILDGLAEHNEIPSLTAEQKLLLAREFTDAWDDDYEVEAIASDFLTQLTKRIRKQGRYYLKAQRGIRLAAEENAELDAGQCNF